MIVLFIHTEQASIQLPDELAPKVTRLVHCNKLTRMRIVKEAHVSSVDYVFKDVVSFDGFPIRAVSIIYTK